MFIRDRAMRMWRFLIVIAAVLGGMFGVAIACTALVYHLASIENYGVAYISPFAVQDSAVGGRRDRPCRD